MIDEAHALAARIAAASAVFPLPRRGDWDSGVRVTAAGDAISVEVREHMGRATRRYRAVLQLVEETQTAPVTPGDCTPGGSRSSQSIHQNERA